MKYIGELVAFELEQKMAMAEELERVLKTYFEGRVERHGGLLRYSVPNALDDPDIVSITVCEPITKPEAYVVQVSLRSSGDSWCAEVYSPLRVVEEIEKAVRLAVN